MRQAPLPRERPSRGDLIAVRAERRNGDEQASHCRRERAVSRAVRTVCFRRRRVSCLNCLANVSVADPTFLPSLSAYVLLNLAERARDESWKELPGHSSGRFQFANDSSTVLTCAGNGNGAAQHLCAGRATFPSVQSASRPRGAQGAGPRARERRWAPCSRLCLGAG